MRSIHSSSFNFRMFAYEKQKEKLFCGVSSYVCIETSEKTYNLEKKLLTPIWPKHPTLFWMKRNSTWFFQSICNDSGDKISIQIGHAYGIGTSIGPIQMRIYPIYGQSISSDDIMINHYFAFETFINWSPEMEKQRYKQNSAKSKQKLETLTADNNCVKVNKICILMSSLFTFFCLLGN